MGQKRLIPLSPQIHSGSSTRIIMGLILLAGVPASLWGIVFFGPRVAWLILTSIAASMGTELILNAIFRRPKSLGDLSACVTGLMVAFSMPPHVPLFVPLLASAFAIAVVKWSFGGLGANWMNPAMAGYAFVFFSWSSVMTQWVLPQSGVLLIDSLSGPTPLGAVRDGLTRLSVGVDGPMMLLESLGMPLTYFDLFLGRVSGSVGEVSALLLILGGLFLTAVRVINWEIPLGYLASFALFVWAFDGLQYDGGLFSGDVVFHLFSGALMLGAWFLATDMVTTPTSLYGRIIFAVGCGVMTFFIRRFGNMPEGVGLAIIFMNIFTPIIDQYIRPKRYGVNTYGVS